MQNNSNMYIHKSILFAIRHRDGTVILHINLYSHISLHTICSWIRNIIDYNQLRHIFSNSKDVHSVPYEDDRKWLKYEQVCKYGTVLSMLLVYCFGYFIKYFLVLIRLSTKFHDRVLIYSSAILSSDISPK